MSSSELQHLGRRVLLGLRVERLSRARVFCYNSAEVEQGVAKRGLLRGEPSEAAAVDGAMSEDWVQSLQRGDGAGLRAAYLAHHETVRAFGRRLLGDEQAAEDLVQDVFLRLPRAILRFRGDSRAESFLLGLAANEARHHVRGAARRRAAMARYAEMPQTAAASPDERAVRQQLAAKLQEGLQELNLKHRTVFILCEVEERSSSEVAAILGCPASTVRDRLTTARRQLESWAQKEGLK